MHHEDMNRLERLANLMDSQFGVPGTNIRIGLDSLMGLIPGIGDTAALGVSSYIILQARRAGASHWLMTRMGWNVFIDWLIGLIPLVGDLFDVGFKANRKNVELLKAHLAKTP